MGLFKSIKKGVSRLRKNLHLPALTLGNAVKAAGAIAVPGGALGAVAGSVLRSKLKSAGIAGGKQILRTKAAKALVSRVAKLAPPAGASSQATTMPGGAPLSPTRALARKSPTTSHRRRKGRGKATKAAGTKRRAPTGGLDLKALSASWRAAGKPGRWIDWVKSHR